MIAMIPLTLIYKDGAQKEIQAASGSNLRRVLLASGFSPYTAVTRKLNCGGNGLCATCGVWIEKGAPPPVHWHDRLADKFGYPRLSCQVTVDRSMTIRQVDKWIWGPSRKWKLMGKGK